MAHRILHLWVAEAEDWHNGCVAHDLYCEVHRRYGAHVVVHLLNACWHTQLQARAYKWRLQPYTGGPVGLLVRLGAAPTGPAQRVVDVGPDWSTAGRTLWPIDLSGSAAMWRKR